jgi:hypothetical protein
MKTQSSGQADGPTGILVENWPLCPRSELGLQLGPRKQPFGFVWFSYNAPTGAPPRAPWGTPSCRDLPQAPGKDQVDRTTLGPPTNAGGGGVRVNLVQTGWCELKSRGYGTRRGLAAFCLGALWAVGCSWHPVVLVCAKGKKAPAMLARRKARQSWCSSPSLHRRREKITWPRRPSFDTGKK